MTSISSLSPVALLVVSLVALGCGNKDAAPAPGASTAAHPPAAAAPATAATSATAPSKPAAGGTCSIAGNWAGVYPPGPYPFSGHPISMSFNPDGTGVSESERANSEYAWKMEGTTLTFHGTKPVPPGRFSCQPTDVARVALQFDTTCNTVTIKLESDPCKGRALTENGMTLKRK